MAVIKMFKTFVEVNGTPLKEYKDPGQQSEGDTKCTKYIEVPSLATFKIRVNFAQNFKPQKKHVSVEVYIDGDYVNGSVLHRSAHDGLLSNRELLVEGRTRTLTTGEKWFSPFQFQELECR